MRLPKLTGERINLRHLTRSDTGAFQPLANDLRVAEFLPRLRIAPPPVCSRRVSCKYLT